MSDPMPATLPARIVAAIYAEDERCSSCGRPDAHAYLDAWGKCGDCNPDEVPC